MTFQAADPPREIPAVPPVPGKAEPVPPEMPMQPGITHAGRSADAGAASAGPAGPCRLRSALLSHQAGEGGRTTVDEERSRGS